MLLESEFFQYLTYRAKGAVDAEAQLTIISFSYFNPVLATKTLGIKGFPKFNLRSWGNNVSTESAILVDALTNSGARISDPFPGSLILHDQQVKVHNA